jgi:hypothetical protein
VPPAVPVLVATDNPLQSESPESSLAGLQVEGHALPLTQPVRRLPGRHSGEGQTRLRVQVTTTALPNYEPPVLKALQDPTFVPAKGDGNRNSRHSKASH